MKTIMLLLLTYLFIYPSIVISQWTSDPDVNAVVWHSYFIKTYEQYDLYNTVVWDKLKGAIVVIPDWQLNYDYNETDNIYAQKFSKTGNKLWGSDSIPVTLADGAQEVPQAVSDGAGGAIIVWEDYRDGSYWGQNDLYAQRIDANGNAQWTANGITVAAGPGYKFMPQVISDGSGGAFIFWIDGRNFSSSRQDIYAQRINSEGESMWQLNGIPVSQAFNEQWNPRIVSDENGGVILVWEDLRNSNNQFGRDLYAQRIDKTGELLWGNNGIPVCTAAGEQDNAMIISDGTGGAIISWIDRRIQSGSELYIQRINSEGIIKWTNNGFPYTSGTFNRSTSKYYSITSDCSGGAITTWTDTRTPGIYAQRITFSGTIKWKNNGIPVSSLTGKSDKPVILSDGKGGAIISWSYYANFLYAPADIYAQRISSSGTLLFKKSGIVLKKSPHIFITSPQNGVEWIVGSNPILRWESKHICGYINIDLSTDNGATWLRIKEKELNDGDYGKFIVPPYPNTETRIRISDFINSTISDERYYIKIVEPVIQITYPAGGEIWKVGSSPRITWKSSALSKFVNIDLSINGGTSWISLSKNEPDDGDLRTWKVPDFPSTKCKIRVMDISGYPIRISNGYFTITKSTGKLSADNTETVQLPTEFALDQNYPNPFNPVTVISYQLPVISHTTLKIYDLLGKEVATLVNEEKAPGYYQVKFDGSNLSTGIYIYRLNAGSFTSTKKLLLMK